MSTATPTLERAQAVVAAVIDPELPMLTIGDLGVLRDVELDDNGRVVVTLTPTYTGCPAMAAMREDVARRLHDAGFAEVDVRTALHPAWSTDWITPHGRRALAAAGLSPPGPAPARSGPVPVNLGPPNRDVRCPRCGSDDAELTSEFGATACTALYRCTACSEPFPHVKEL